MNDRSTPGQATVITFQPGIGRIRKICDRGFWSGMLPEDSAVSINQTLNQLLGSLGESLL